MFKVTVLGTAAATPTRERGLPALALQREGKLLLFDCGEGTQRQMMLARPPLSNPDYIFVSHMHGDHVLGIPGLLQSLALQDRRKALNIFGPKGLKEFVECNLEALKVNLPYKLILRKTKVGTILEEEAFVVRAEKTEHADESYAYRLDERSRPGRFHPEKALSLGVPRGPLWKKLQDGRAVKVNGELVRPSQVLGPRRRGRSLGYSGDARPTERLARFFRRVDLLVFDGTYSSEYADKAMQYSHSTVEEGAKLAAKARVGRLILTHISARMNDEAALLEQAKSAFRNAEIAHDFLSVELPLP